MMAAIRLAAHAQHFSISKFFLETNGFSFIKLSLNSAACTWEKKSPLRHLQNYLYSHFYEFVPTEFSSQVIENHLSSHLLMLDTKSPQLLEFSLIASLVETIVV